MRDLQGVTRSLAAAAHLGLALLSMIAGGCRSSDPPGSAIDGPPAPVTITFLRHDNSTYRMADNAFFAEYMAAHPNVTIVDTTVDFRTLASTLIAELRRDQFMYDLVLIPPSR